MALLESAVHCLSRLRTWQRTTGQTGEPPPDFDRELSQWLKDQRTLASRGRGDKKLHRHLSDFGVSVHPEPVRHDHLSVDLKAMNGMLPVLCSLQRLLDDGKQVPSLLSSDLGQRQAAAWLIRIQAGIVPPSYVCGWSRLVVDHQTLPARVLDRAARMQSQNDLLAEWALWCARIRCIRRSQTRYRTWHDAAFAHTHDHVQELEPELVWVAWELRLGNLEIARFLPHPAHVVFYIQSLLSTWMKGDVVAGWSEGPYSQRLLTGATAPRVSNPDLQAVPIVLRRAFLAGARHRNTDATVLPPNAGRAAK